jgi:hypothetical protein
MFVGDVVGHTASFPSAGVPTLTVAAQDRRQRLHRGTKVRWFGVPVPSVGTLPIPDPIVAADVALDNGLAPIVEPVGAALAVLLGAGEAAAAGDADARQKLVRKQDGVSDHDFLTTIARENGWELIVEHRGPLGGSQLRFFSPLDHLAADVTLKYGRSLVDFTPRISTVGQVAAITAYVWVAEIKQAFEVTVGWDWERTALTIDVRPAQAGGSSASSAHLIDEPLTPASAPRRIISELIPRLNQRLTGSGSAIGDPRIRPGTVLRLEGLGTQFGGLYRVTSVTHTLDGGGYRTAFEVRKEIWFGAIPLPEQGAVAITAR